MKNKTNIFILLFMNFLLTISCTSNKAKKVLEEIVQEEDSINTSVNYEKDMEGSSLNKEETDKSNATFSDFLSGFPEKSIPFNLKDISFSSYIDSNFVLKYIDPQYLKKDSIEREEAETEYDYTPLQYAYAGKMGNFTDFSLVAYYQIRENVGPRGNFTIATFDNEGVLIDSINLDVFNIYLEGSETAIVYSDSIKVNLKEKEYIIPIDKTGKLKH